MNTAMTAVLCVLAIGCSSSTTSRLITDDSGGAAGDTGSGAIGGATAGTGGDEGGAAGATQGSGGTAGTGGSNGGAAGASGGTGGAAGATGGTGAGGTGGSASTGGAGGVAGAPGGTGGSPTCSVKEAFDYSVLPDRIVLTQMDVSYTAGVGQTNETTYTLSCLDCVNFDVVYTDTIWTTSGAEDVVSLTFEAVNSPIDVHATILPGNGLGFTECRFTVTYIQKVGLDFVPVAGGYEAHTYSVTAAFYSPALAEDGCFLTGMGLDGLRQAGETVYKDAVKAQFDGTFFACP